MAKITHNDLPAAIEAIMLRIDILHDLVKSTKDAVDKLIRETGKFTGEGETNKIQSDDEIPVFQGEELYNIAKAAQFLGISVSKLYLLVEQRQIAHFSKLNKLFFKRQDLEIYRQRISGKKAPKPSKPLQDEPSLILGEEDDALLSMEEAVEHTGFSRTSLYAYAKSKRIPFIKKGRRLFFPIVALNQLMISDIEKPFRTRRKKSGSPGR